MVGWQIYHLPKYKPVTSVPNTVVNFSGQNPTVPVQIAPGGGFVRGHLVGFFEVSLLDFLEVSLMSSSKLCPKVLSYCLPRHNCNHDGFGFDM